MPAGVSSSCPLTDRFIILVVVPFSATKEMSHIRRKNCDAFSLILITLPSLHSVAKSLLLIFLSAIAFTMF